MEQGLVNQPLEQQIRECYGRVVWAHKVHEKCADLLNKKLDRIKFWQIILSAIITTGILISVFGDSVEVGIAAALISFALTVLNTYVKQYNLGETAQKHSDAAISIWSIRESYLSLLTDINSGEISQVDARKLRDSLQTKLEDIYRGSPRTNDKAYKETSKALNKLDEMTFSDEEIDKFLPSGLRRSK